MSRRTRVASFDDGLRDYARSQHERRLNPPATITTIVHRVPCELSKDGWHRAEVRLSAHGEILGLSCDCDRRHGNGVGMTGWRLGLKNTCGRALELVRIMSLRRPHHEIIRAHVDEWRATWPENVRRMFEEGGRDLATVRSVRRTHKPPKWERPAVRIVAKRIGDLVGHDVFTVGITNNRITSILVRNEQQDGGDIEIAKSRGRGWRLLLKPNATKLIGRISGTRCSVCDQTFAGSHAERHFTSDKHESTVEKAFVNALGSLMPDKSDD